MSSSDGTDTGAVRPAAARFLSALRADHEMLRRYDNQYGVPRRPPEPLAKDIVQRVGLQMMAAYRLMRFFAEAGAPLPAKVIGRLIRILYGADIHYDAQLEQGVVIVHGMGISINQAVRVGSGVILSQNVTLGAGIDPVTRETGAPRVEENVHIGPGATVTGPVTVGARSKIVAGAVVMASIPPGSLVETPPPRVSPRRAPGTGQG